MSHPIELPDTGRPVTVYFHSELDDPLAWAQILTEALPDLRFLTGPACDSPESVDIALVWTPPPQGLNAFPNLRAVLSLGAGVDQLQLDSLRNPQISVARLVDPTLTARMVDYCKAAVFYLHRNFHVHQRQQVRRVWKFIAPVDAGTRRILILGQGVLGAAVAVGLADEGFHVSGWSRSPKGLPNVKSLCGENVLAPALAESDIVINLLPLTSQTRGILNRGFFSQIKPDTCLINVGRGAHLNEPDLLEALDEGKVAAAFLDVFDQEPLPPEHPFWSYAQVHVTPHVASLSDPAHSAATVIENIRRAMNRLPLVNAVDRSTGY
ncbi:glyoxylate/hydroxypyruvate reductase A [Polaromonas sp. P1(28)-13]|nr:glyoxylate/hydroxypyruvate reductase A [Polaromonas sp. P1(28)-13]